jgi:hypothetical protein
MGRKCVLHVQTRENTTPDGRCRECRRIAHLSWKRKHPEMMRKYLSEYNKKYRDRLNKNAVRRRKENPEKGKKYYRLWTYGLTEEQYEAILKAQHGICICGVDFDTNQHKPCVDHDHKCCPGNRSCGKCVRGILGRSCNIALGLLKDDYIRLERLARHAHGEKL